MVTHFLRSGLRTVAMNAAVTCFSRLDAFRPLERAHGEFRRRMAAVSSLASAADILQGVNALDEAERELADAKDRMMNDTEQHADVFCAA
ncbi:MAG TPA: hypothetical protein VMV33_17575 [Rhodocyclaceae bacterium]|nr:hypothetical protein [Rhodocyclaceae bacterium]